MEPTVRETWSVLRGRNTGSWFAGVELLPRADLYDLFYVTGEIATHYLI